MSSDIYSELYDHGVFQYGSDELIKFEKQLTTYFTREYKRYKNNDSEFIDLGKGALALVSEKLADAHYDEGIALFKNFLDKKTMSYSMAYYDSEPAAVLKSKKSLTEAQTDKFKLISKRMKLKGNEKLLNFGCGFCYFESYLLNFYPDLQISSLTHSKDQYNTVVSRKKDSTDPLSSNRFQVYYGEIGDNSSSILGKSQYDVVSSVGLMEHINNVEQFLR